MWCCSSVCLHRAIANLLQPASTLCGVVPVCVFIELLQTFSNLPQPCVVLFQCVCLHRAIANLQPCVVLQELLQTFSLQCVSSSTLCGVVPVCVSVHRAIANSVCLIEQPAYCKPSLCGVVPVCVFIELLQTFSTHYIKSTLGLGQPPTITHCVVLFQAVTLHRAIANQHHTGFRPVEGDCSSVCLHRAIAQPSQPS